jgi:hypothetical protein
MFPVYHETRHFEIWGRHATQLIVPKSSGLQNSDEVSRNGISFTQKKNRRWHVLTEEEGYMLLD